MTINGKRCAQEYSSRRAVFYRQEHVFYPTLVVRRMYHTVYIFCAFTHAEMATLALLHMRRSHMMHLYAVHLRFWAGVTKVISVCIGTRKNVQTSRPKAHARIQHAA